MWLERVEACMSKLLLRAHYKLMSQKTKKNVVFIFMPFACSGGTANYENNNAKPATLYFFVAARYTSLHEQSNVHCTWFKNFFLLPHKQGIPIKTATHTKIHRNRNQPPSFSFSHIFCIMLPLTPPRYSSNPQTKFLQFSTHPIGYVNLSNPHRFPFSTFIYIIPLCTFPLLYDASVKLNNSALFAEYKNFFHSIPATYIYYIHSFSFLASSIIFYCLCTPLLVAI